MVHGLNRARTLIQFSTQWSSDEANSVISELSGNLFVLCQLTRPWSEQHTKLSEIELELLTLLSSKCNESIREILEYCIVVVPDESQGSKSPPSSSLHMAHGVFIITHRYLHFILSHLPREFPEELAINLSSINQCLLRAASEISPYRASVISDAW
jgi:hypothetical protein